MVSRRELKDRAKNFLRGNYWKAFIVCLIAVTIIGTSDSNMFLRFRQNEIFKIQSGNEYADSSGLLYKNGNIVDWDGNVVQEIGPENKDKLFIVQNNPFIELFTDTNILLGYIKLQTYIIIGVVLFIFSITIGSVLEVGKDRFFLRGFKGEAEISDLFSIFNWEEYFSIFKTQFMKGLYILLWTFVLIIPGIIKSFEYILVPYILAEDATISTKEALKRSSEMTDGYKWEIFVLGLSFILWTTLGLLTFGIGGVFVTPYIEATYAKMYVELSSNIVVRDEAIEEGIILD